MQALTDYSAAFDVEGERAEVFQRCAERAADDAFIDLKCNPLRRSERAEAWQALLDSQTGPSPNDFHSRLIEGLAALDAELMTATDAKSSRGRMLLLDAIVCTAFDDLLIARAQA